MVEKVVFYSLNQKFLEKDSDVPEQAQQVMYYSLAIGHHVGVIDCFKEVMECPFTQYVKWIENLPEGEARRKMSGLLKFGEIVIDSTHVGMLGAAFLPLRGKLTPEFNEWTQVLLELLEGIVYEPAVYLMVKRCSV